MILFYLAPSPEALQKLNDCCCKFAEVNNAIFNCNKTVSMYISSKRFNNLDTPPFYFDGACIRQVKKNILDSS